MTSPVIVGVTGYATSGKDTFAQGLIDQLGFVKIAFADALRRDIEVLNPIVHTNTYAVDGDIQVEHVRASDCFEDYNKSKSIYPEFRRLLQVYGTEVHRALDDEYWIDRAFQKVGNAPGYVFTDMRFSNEREGIEYDLTVRVNRPGVGPVNDHASEAFIGTMNVDVEVINDGSPDELAAQAVSILSLNMTASTSPFNFSVSD